MTTGLALAILVVFLVVDARLRSGSDAQNLTAGSRDRGTTRLIGYAIGLSFAAMIASLFVDGAGVPLPDAVEWVGLAVMGMGLALRIWAMRVLGASYTRTLRTRGDQELVTSGPYRVVRHPGYAGSLLLWLGAGLATGSAALALVIVGVHVAAYAARISAEEAMLGAEFGVRYAEYARRTWRLVPFLY